MSLSESSYETLCQATIKGEVELVQKILTADKSIVRNVKWIDYKLLILALQRDQRDVVIALLQLGCRVNLIPHNNLHHSSLYYAVGLNDIALVRMLLEKGAFINLKKNEEETALVIAMKHKQYEIVDLILSMYHFDEIDPESNDDIKHFLIACERNQIEVVKRFIDSGMSVNSYVTDIPSRYFSYTPLHYAVANLSPILVDFLLSKGADFMAKDGNNWTALQLANQIKQNFCQTKNERIDLVGPIIVMLLSRQCEVYDSIDNETTALSHFHIACTTDKVHLVKTFLKNGVDVNGSIPFDQSSFSGFTALHHAVCSNCYQVTDLLLNNGANINALTKEHWTPLMFAASLNDLSIVALLLRKGADVNIKNFETLTAVHYAFNVKKRSDVLVDSLLDCAPKDINPTSSNGLSHFHIACARGNPTVIMAFIENKVDINARVGFKSSKYPGYSPLHFAVEFSQLQVVDILIKNHVTVNIKDMYDMTPLHLACFQNYKTLLVMLNELKLRRSNEAITNWRNSCDKTIQIINSLLMHNADVHIKDVSKATPLHYAFGTEQMKNTIEKEVMSMEIYIPVYISTLDPLNASQEKIAEMLIKQGANVDSLQNRNRTPLHNACIFTSAYKCLLKADCNINALDIDGNSPLFLACQAQNVPAIRDLLKFGADINIVNSNNQNIFYILHKDERYNYLVFRALQTHYTKMLAFGIKFNKSFEDSYFYCRKRYERKNHQYLSDSESDSDYEDSEDAYFDFTTDAMYKQCKLELQIMKTKKISNFSTLYDVMYKNSVDMAKIIKNENLKKLLMSNEFDNQFPQYRDFLLLQFRRGTVRDSLMVPAMESLNFLSGLTIPDACLDQIFKNLDNNSLRNLIKSVHTVEVQKRKLQTLIVDSEPTIKHLRIRDQ